MIIREAMIMRSRGTYSWKIAKARDFGAGVDESV